MGSKKGEKSMRVKKIINHMMIHDLVAINRIISKKDGLAEKIWEGEVTDLPIRYMPRRIEHVRGYNDTLHIYISERK